jgi:hypothetical protein
VLQKLVSFDDWPVWEELFLSFMRKLRNPCTGFAIDYEIRPVGELSMAARSPDYKVINEHIFALATR